MEKSETICPLLGTTQKEMTMLFKIPRSQWSMFESGKRGIPVEARELLGKILVYVKAAKAKAAKRPSQQEQLDTKKKLKTSLKKNQFQQREIDRKVAALEKKQTALASAAHVIDYLENHTDKTENHMKEMSKFIQYRTDKDRQRNGLPTLVTYQIKQKVLQYEEVLLKEALEK